MVKVAEKKAPVEEEVAPDVESRIDDYAVAVFRVYGLTGRLPDKLVELYNEFKRYKDHLNPGRLSPEGFAFVMILSRM